jgi:hypothetical protein
VIGGVGRERVAGESSEFLIQGELRFLGSFSSDCWILWFLM